LSLIKRCLKLQKLHAMNDVRSLEKKYARQIKWHLNKAFPALNARFAKLKMSTDYADSNLSYDLSYFLHFTISVRIRKYKYINYKDMTIRYKSKANMRTEFDKIVDGYAQIYFYAYESKDENDLVKVRIVDVNAIRKMIENKNYSVYTNNDGTELAAFTFQEISNLGGAIYQYD
jgi:hypothetical protein